MHNLYILHVVSCKALHIKWDCLAVLFTFYWCFFVVTALGKKLFLSLFVCALSDL